MQLHIGSEPSMDGKIRKWVGILKIPKTIEPGGCSPQGKQVGDTEDTKYNFLAPHVCLNHVNILQSTKHKEYTLKP